MTVLKIQPFGTSLDSTVKEQWMQVLRAWGEIQDRFIPGDPGEINPYPYAFNERASVALLAGGIWGLSPNNVVMEEYATRKLGGSVSGRRRAGRADMWCRLKSAGLSATSYVCEAKALWPRLRGKKKLVDELSTAIKDALDQVRTYNEPAQHWPVALVFVTPHTGVERGIARPEVMQAFMRRLEEGTEGLTHAGLRGDYYPGIADMNHDTPHKVWFPGTSLLVAFDSSPCGGAGTS